MKDSKIQWTHHTFNPWRGCTKVSAGCANCYAEAMSGRNPGVLGVWGKYGTRIIASESMWREPVKWNRKAREAGERQKVFCASLADVFEGPETMSDRCFPRILDARMRLFRLIISTGNLDWLLLTKRPENIGRFTNNGPECCLPPYVAWDNRPANVWLGVSVEDQLSADTRIPHLIQNGHGMIRFLSCEPLLGPLDLTPYFGSFDIAVGSFDIGDGYKVDRGIDWVIVGGESGSHSRPLDLEWVESIVEQCRQANVPCFVKQLGSRPLACGERIQLGGKKGEVIEDWPEFLQVRQFPQVIR